MSKLDTVLIVVLAVCIVYFGCLFFDYYGRFQAQTAESITQTDIYNLGVEDTPLEAELDSVPEETEEIIVEEHEDMVSAEEFKSIGILYLHDYSYTWYSQRVLPGGGLTALNNNGRHVDDRGFVCDGDGYISVASDDFEMGSIVETPFGDGKVYDCGSGKGNIDIYVDF